MSGKFQMKMQQHCQSARLILEIDELLSRLLSTISGNVPTRIQDRVLKIDRELEDESAFTVPALTAIPTFTTRAFRPRPSTCNPSWTALSH
jgi:hypothetical protein